MNRLLLTSLSLLMVALPLGTVWGQTYTVLHHFDGLNGNGPLPGLVLWSNTLYGTTVSGGGDSNYGTLFKINTDGTGFTNLHRFAGGSEGANPKGRLLVSSNVLYGTTESTVFALRTDGTAFTNLHTFSSLDLSNGIAVYDGLVLASNTLYGTTFAGGSSLYGTLFALHTDGTGFTNLHDFTGVDGQYPYGGLVLAGNTLYGTAQGGGAFGNGTVFSVNRDGSAFTVLHTFSSTVDYPNTNSDGAAPQGDLVLSAGVLYGTTPLGGSDNAGTVFALSADGSGFRTLHHFALDGSDGAYSAAGLILSGNTLFGTASRGGTADNGTVFAVNTDGTGFKALHNFSRLYPPNVANPTNTEGAFPWGTLVLSGSALYGATLQGGLSGFGTVFRISLVPDLSIATSGTDIVLAWPTQYAAIDFSGFTLQSATNLVFPVWTAVLPSPVTVNGQFTVTNRVSETQRFFRLSR